MKYYVVVLLIVGIGIAGCGYSTDSDSSGTSSAKKFSGPFSFRGPNISYDGPCTATVIIDSNKFIVTIHTDSLKATVTAVSNSGRAVRGNGSTVSYYAYDQASTSWSPAIYDSSSIALATATRDLDTLTFSQPGAPSMSFIIWRNK